MKKSRAPRPHQAIPQAPGNRLWQAGALLFLFAAYAFLATQKIGLCTADLGRHIKNGEIILRTGSVAQTNYYSYTYPDAPFINHHWGSGVVFFLIWKLSGFPGLSLFYALLGLLTLWLFFDAARRESGFGPAAYACAILLPLMAARTEIRPEGLSYLFCGAFYWLLAGHRQGRVRGRALWLLPLGELLWVNLHIYFILGLGLLGIFALECAVEARLRRDQAAGKRLKEIGVVLPVAAALCFCNPATWRGVLAPFNIFQNYGYRLFENQSVWFIDRLVKYPPTLYFKIGFVFLAASAFWALLKKGRAFPLANILLAVIFSALGWLAVRNFTIFAFMALPLAAANIRLARPQPERLGAWRGFLAALPLAVTALSLFHGLDIRDRQAKFGLGLLDGVNGAADFYNREKISGPVLNNYDIGGYLIFHLYPAQRVFVDNRPEAYPASFFQDVYVPMMENEEQWKAQDAAYAFNSIFFFRHDLTPHGQAFMIKRVFDPAWAPVYVDAWNIILARRCPRNQELIARYEIPQRFFTVTPN